MLAWREIVNFFVQKIVHLYVGSQSDLSDHDISANSSMNHCESYLEEYIGSNPCVYGPCAVYYLFVCEYFQTESNRCALLFNEENRYDRS